MAVIDLSVTVPADEMQRVRNALRANFGENMTNPELVERMRQEVIGMVTGMVRRYEVSAACSSITDVDVT